MATTEQLTTTIAGTWKADPSHSELGFAVKHSGVATVRGRLAEFEAVLEAGDDGLRISGRGPVASLTTDDADRDAHLRSPDFFDAEQYPEITFASDEVVVDGDDVTVRGQLTIKGVTKPVELRGEIAGPVVDAFGNTRVGLELTGTIDRTEFGVSWNAPLPGGDMLLSNRVKLTATFSFLQA